MSKTVGVLGGMGPAATADFFSKLVRRTPAHADADHLHVIIDSDPRIPDRTKALLDHGPSPVPALLRAGRNLVAAGAELIAIPCITAHAFLDDLRRQLPIPVLSALELTADLVDRQFPPGSPLAILSTSGTLKTQLFQKALPKTTFILPDPTQQNEIVMDAIYGPRGIKTVGVDPATRQRVFALIRHLQQRTAVAVIAGCTEFSVMFNDADPPLPLIDPMRILADAVVREARSPSP
jgi:aspartate racemase